MSALPKYVSLLERAARMVIARTGGPNGCENYVPPHTCESLGRERYGGGTAVQWCDPCELRVALEDDAEEVQRQLERARYWSERSRHAETLLRARGIEFRPLMSYGDDTTFCPEFALDKPAAHPPETDA